MNPYGSKQLAASFRTVRKNTIQIAEDIPESKYVFTPAEGMRSVAEQLTHIAVATRFWTDIHGTKKLTDMTSYDFNPIARQLNAEQQRQRSKAEILDLLQTEGEGFARLLEGFSDEELAVQILQRGQESRSRLEWLMSAKEHEMHHRGQLMVVERMLGIVPHLTRQFEERMREMEKERTAAQPA